MKSEYLIKYIEDTLNTVSTNFQYKIYDSLKMDNDAMDVNKINGIARIVSGSFEPIQGVGISAVTMAVEFIYPYERLEAVKETFELVAKNSAGVVVDNSTFESTLIGTTGITINYPIQGNYYNGTMGETAKSRLMCYFDINEKAVLANQVKLGFLKAPVGLENVTSGRYYEKLDPVTVLAVGYEAKTLPNAYDATKEWYNKVGYSYKYELPSLIPIEKVAVPYYFEFDPNATGVVFYRTDTDITYKQVQTNSESSGVYYVKNGDNYDRKILPGEYDSSAIYYVQYAGSSRFDYSPKSDLSNLKNSYKIKYATFAKVILPDDYNKNETYFQFSSYGGTKIPVEQDITPAYVQILINANRKETYYVMIEPIMLDLPQAGQQYTYSGTTYYDGGIGCAKIIIPDGSATQVQSFVQSYYKLISPQIVQEITPVIPQGNYLYVENDEVKTATMPADYNPNVDYYSTEIESVPYFKQTLTRHRLSTTNKYENNEEMQTVNDGQSIDLSVAVPSIKGSTMNAIKKDMVRGTNIGKTYDILFTDEDGSYVLKGMMPSGDFGYECVPGSNIIFKILFVYKRG